LLVIRVERGSFGVKTKCVGVTLGGLGGSGLFDPLAGEISVLFFLKLLLRHHRFDVSVGRTRSASRAGVCLSNGFRAGSSGGSCACSSGRGASTGGRSGSRSCGRGARIIGDFGLFYLCRRFAGAGGGNIGLILGAVGGFLLIHPLQIGRGGIFKQAGLVPAIAGDFELLAGSDPVAVAVKPAGILISGLGVSFCRFGGIYDCGSGRLGSISLGGIGCGAGLLRVGLLLFIHLGEDRIGRFLKQPGAITTSTGGIQILAGGDPVTLSVLLAPFFVHRINVATPGGPELLGQGNLRGGFVFSAFVGELILQGGLVLLGGFVVILLIQRGLALLKGGAGSFALVGG